MLVLWKNIINTFKYHEVIDTIIHLLIFMINTWQTVVFQVKMTIKSFKTFAMVLCHLATEQN